MAIWVFSLVNAFKVFTSLSEISLDFTCSCNFFILRFTISFFNDKIAFSVVNSPLVKTAISGEDANWGRIIAAIGKSQEKIDQNKIKIFFGKNMVCQKGSINNKINLSRLNKYMKNKVIEISIYLQNGNINHTVYGNDITNEYIRINADYRS